MIKIDLVLRGAHGGELDRKELRIRPDQEESAIIGNALIGAIEGGWVLNAGDTITIQAIIGG
jgi:hypothetical protein